MNYKSPDFKNKLVFLCQVDANVQASKILRTSVGDPDPPPDPDPQDPHVFEHPGSGSFPILINVMDALKQCLQNIIFNTNF
jgi:hypothetical protein